MGTLHSDEMNRKKVMHSKNSNRFFFVDSDTSDSDDSMFDQKNLSLRNKKLMWNSEVFKHKRTAKNENVLSEINNGLKNKKECRIKLSFTNEKSEHPLKKQTSISNCRPALTSQKKSNKKKMKVKICKAKKTNSRHQRIYKMNHIKRVTRRPSGDHQELDKNEPLSLDDKTTHLTQDNTCVNFAPNLKKCRECLKNTSCKKSEMVSSYCCFANYRKLAYTAEGLVAVGFLSPSECRDEDKLIWLPHSDFIQKGLTVDTSKYILSCIHNLFHDIIQEEGEAVVWHMGNNKTTWKKVIKDTQEECDICDTILFNVHWICPECGLNVCFDCYKVINLKIVLDEKKAVFSDKYSKILCHDEQPHSCEKLLLAQVIPNDVLKEMENLLTDVCKKWKINLDQTMQEYLRQPENLVICKKLMGDVRTSFCSKETNSMPVKSTSLGLDNDNSSLSENIHAAFGNSSKKENENFLDRKENSFESFALINNIVSFCNGNDDANTVETLTNKELKDWLTDYLNIDMRSGQREENNLLFTDIEQIASNIDCNTMDSKISINTEIPGTACPSWFCNGKVLFLSDITAEHSNTLELFREQWRKCRPVIVSGIDKNLDPSFWNPIAFSKKFKKSEFQLFDDKDKDIKANGYIKQFWDGFQHEKKRPKHRKGETVLLRFDDWPYKKSFMELFPQKYEELLNALPISEYTLPNGVFNLAARLPEGVLQPNFGPDIISCYGFAFFPNYGSTNLTISVSDVLNVLVFATVPKPCDENRCYLRETYKIIDNSGCDSFTKLRVRKKDTLPCALWHIYKNEDNEKIRAFLKKIAEEQGLNIPPHSDPLYDSLQYLNANLRKRLYDEYGVSGYTLVQCVGDAIFIPAGTAYQVLNLLCCTNVVQRFISPENICHSLTLMKNLRTVHLEPKHKLPIQALIYHSMKDVVSCLLKENSG